MDIPRRPKVVSDTKRERDVRLYGATFRDIPHLEQLPPSLGAYALPGDYVPRPAKDSALMAFAQLAAIRLGGRRAMISLIDDQRQHILAEATPAMSLRFGAKHHATGDLWLGNMSLPRSLLLCETILCVDPACSSSDKAAVVINDLKQSEQLADRTYVKDNTVRSYFGVPLLSPRGAIVGALSVLDDKPRNGIPQEDILYLQDLAATIVEHLDTDALKDQHSRGEQLTRGLISFAEGASALQQYNDDQNTPTSQSCDDSQHTSALPQYHENPDISAVRPSKENRNASGPTTPVPSVDSLQTALDSEALPSKEDGLDSVHALQDSILPANSKAMFARAANIMRASSDLDGVLILDASVAAGSHRNQGNDTGESSYDSISAGQVDGPPRYPGSARNPASQPSSANAGQRCQILGFSTRETSSLADNIWALKRRSVLEADLRRMFNLFPDGKILQFTAKGEAISSTDDSESSASTIRDLGGSMPPSRQKRRRYGMDRMQKTLYAIQATLPHARSVAFVPFWDFERSRWFAGCLCWSNRPDRLLSPKLDLLFFKVFSHSVMNEFAKLDTIASNRVKTSFVSLISHELRSPLHGILGSIQFMQDSPLDSFQVTMLNSMAACGQTLLDTIDHVLDYSKINETKRNVSSKRMKGLKTICLSSKPLKAYKPSTTTSQDPSFDLGLVTEEVVEAIFASESYQAVSNVLEDGTISPLDSRSSDQDSMFPPVPTKRQSRFIVLDVADQDWNFCLPAGAWTRTLMNIFGNALKYTQSGRIQVSLRADRGNGSGTFTHVTLTVTDTGVGMSTEFLANKLFQPFLQENPHAFGTGLGLSIVRQIIETIGGEIEVSSDAISGTQVVVRLALSRPETPRADLPQRIQFLEALPRLEGRKICILNKNWSEAPNEIHTREAHKHFTDALASTLTKLLQMEVIHASEEEGHDADIVICPEPSFSYLSTIRNQRSAGKRAPVAIFVAMDGLEAATFRSDARILNKESVVEIMTQPCGPYKLANILTHCLTRYESADENLQHHSPKASYPFLLASSEQSPTTPLVFDLLKMPDAEILELLPSPLSPPVNVRLDENATLGLHNAPISVSNTSTIPGKSESLHVLIVDDNPINRRLLIAFMKKRKISYQEAENGLEAVTAYEEDRVRFDFILMDISMPVMDGMTATRLIRDYESRFNLERTHIIALTGLANASARLEAWSSGVDTFMTKPADFRALGKLLHGKNGTEKG